VKIAALGSAFVKHLYPNSSSVSVDGEMVVFERQVENCRESIACK
jgi:hypothetical protein